MKKTIVLLITLAMLVSLLCNFTFTANASGDDFKAVLRFVAIADAHFGAKDNTVPQRFAQAMEKFYGIAKADKNHNTVDALVLVGDFVETSAEADYAKLVAALNASVDRDETLILAGFGNHELQLKPGNAQMLDTFDAAEIMKQQIGVDGPDTSVDINGFRFIVSSLRYDMKNGKGWTDKENLDWLARELAEAHAADPEKPIFTFSHIAFKDTVALASYNKWFHDRGFGAPYDVLKNYPQIINFSGHDHYPLNFENSIHQKDFTSVSAGHLKSGVVGGKYGDMSTTSSQCLLVEVDKNNTVRIRKYDVLNDAFIGEDWIVENPSDKSGFIYTDARAEQYKDFTFGDGEILTLNNVSSNGIGVKFNAVKNNPNVIYYRVSAYRGSEEISSTIVRSYVWEKNAQASFEHSVGSLKPDTEYTIKVVAVDSFGNESKPLEINAKTAGKLTNPVYDPNIKIHIYDDLSNAPEGETLFDYTGKGISDDELVIWCGQGYNSKAKLELKDGKITVLSNPSGDWVGPVKFGFGNDIKDVPGAKGFGFYIENNLGKALKISPCAFGKQYILSDPGCLVFTMDVNGACKEYTIASDKGMTLDKDFKGWVFVPLESVVDGYQGNSKFGSENFSILYIAAQFGTAFKEGDGTIVYDDYFVYGDVEDNNNGRIDLSVAITPEPTVEPTAEPTAEPTDEPTEVPGASAPAEPQQSDMTWVYIVIAVVLAAVIVVVAVILKKKQAK